MRFDLASPSSAPKRRAAIRPRAAWLGFRFPHAAFPEALRSFGRNTLGLLAGDRRGASAVEFALLAPTLVLLLGFAAEMGRMFMVHRQFENAVVGVARHVASFPEYESRARAYAAPIAAALIGPQAPLNLVVDSLVRKDGAIEEVFPPHVLLGSDPGIRWQDSVAASGYKEGEALIFVGATMTYRPFFLAGIGVQVTFSKGYTILPFFSRKYLWNNGNSPDKYVF